MYVSYYNNEVVPMLAMKEYGDIRGIAFNLAQAVGELSALCAVHFATRERAPYTD
jgi:hypothetical protein